MMQLNRENIPGAYIIKEYQPGKLFINDSIIEHSVWLNAQNLFPWAPQKLEEIALQDWTEILQQSPDILLIGTGEHFQYPPLPLLTPLYEHQIGFEIMDTAAACRTLMILLSEGRNAAAALLIR